MTNQILHIRDEKTSGTTGDTYTAGVETAHTLNTVKTNTLVGSSLSANQVVLPGGTYWIEGYASLGQRLRLSIYDATNGVYLAKGIPNPIIGPQGGPHAFVRGYVSLSDTTTIELHVNPFATTTCVPSNYGSDPETYAELVVHKLD